MLRLHGSALSAAALLLAAGCLGGAENEQFLGGATGGHAALAPFPTMGVGSDFGGILTVDVSPARDTGRIASVGVWAGLDYRIEFETFSRIAEGATLALPISDLDVRALMAADGWATMHVGTKAVTDPATGEPLFPAKMAFGVAAEQPGLPPAYLIVSSAGPAPQEPIPISVPPTGTGAGSATSPGQHKAHYFLVDNEFPGANATFTFELSATPSLAATQLNVAVQDPKGNVVAEQPIGGSSAASESIQFEVSLEVEGTYMLTVTGQAPNAEYSATGQSMPPAGPVVWSFWWDAIVEGAIPTPSHEGMDDMH